MSTIGLSDIDRISLHPAMDLVPEPGAEDRENLRRDLDEWGQQDPIDITTTGLILDGRTRWQLLREAGAKTVMSRVVTLRDADQTAYVVRRAMNRRHLSPEQKSDMARRLAAVVVDTGPQGERIGYSDKEIAETVGLTRQGVAKAREAVKSNPVALDPPTHVRTETKGGATRLVPKQQPREQKPGQRAGVPYHTSRAFERDIRRLRGYAGYLEDTKFAAKYAPIFAAIDAVLGTAS